MKLDHIKNRHSDVTTVNRSSALTAASTMNNTIKADDDDMPFAICNTVQHVPKKSLMLAANNMMSPKSINNPMRITRNSITFDNTVKPSSAEEDKMRATSISFRNRELDKQITEQVRQLTRPVSRERNSCLTQLKQGLNTRVNSL